MSGEAPARGRVSLAALLLVAGAALAEPMFYDLIDVPLARLIENAELDWKAVDADAFYAAKQSLDEASVRLQEIGIAESLRGD